MNVRDRSITWSAIVGVGALSAVLPVVAPDGLVGAIGLVVAGLVGRYRPC